MAGNSEHGCFKPEAGFIGYLPGAQAAYCFFPPSTVAHRPLANKFLDQDDHRTSASLPFQTADLTRPGISAFSLAASECGRTG